MLKHSLVLMLATMTSSQLFAQSESNKEKNENTSVAMLEEMTVLGSSEDIQSLSGSAHSVDRDALEEFEYTDLNQVLVTIPGVYIRQEDGYGLRPNIGIRGVTADRSQKITIMEDGILIKPAPYSAPAAYYIPNVNRMQAVEVFKGPAAIKFGPNTVGGAINLATRPVPVEATGELDIAYGSYNFQKLRGMYGETFEQFGYMIEGLRYSADGFKELDGGGDTGFERNDVNARFMWRSTAEADIQQRLDLKLGYADEASDETYLGLAEADFSVNPLRRYAASSEDAFNSDHSQVHIIHQMAFNDNVSFINRAYVNRFNRSWLKFDGFVGNDAPTAEEILRDPTGINASFMAIIRGDQDSSSDPNTVIDITDNDREYGSQGLSTDMTYFIASNAMEHKIEAGLRYHHDYVDRDHKQYAYGMLNGKLEPRNNGQVLQKKEFNKSESNALSAYLHDTLTVGDWIINLGARVESIDSKNTDYLNSSKNNKRQHTEVMPGAGVFYHLTENLGILAGVNKGFSPNGPAASDAANPEESINYEYGLRYNQDSLHAEIIGFFSDYKNILGRCRSSGDRDCHFDEFNGGRAEIGGVEVNLEQTYQFSDMNIPLGLSYTYTESAFQESFESNFSQWDEVQKGDEMPYLPENQFRIYSGLKAMNWDILASIKYTDEMRDLPGQGAFDEHQYTQALTVIDLSASYFFNDGITLQLTADNITDEVLAVSYRPFGARPNKPRTFTGTVKFRF
ncbi:MAG: TonB-dependent receptor [Pseudomonadales bacterium]|nr:TonB-dependent receptor [Pseudomonadales bacterium]